MRLSTRLLASFVVVGAITALLGNFALARLTTVHEAAEVVDHDVLPSSGLLAAMNAAVAKIRMAEIEQVLSTTGAQRRWYARDTRVLKSALAHERSLYASFVDTPRETALYSAFTEYWKKYLSLSERVFTLSNDGKTEGAKTLMRGPSQTAFDRASGTLQELIELTMVAGTDAAQRNEVQYAQARTFIIVCSLTAVLLGMLLAFQLSRSITRPLNALVRATERVEAGDLSQRVAIDAHAEFEKLAHTFNRMAEALGAAHDTLEQRVTDRTSELKREKDAHGEARMLAEAANHAKTDFLANMSHELRTPLNSVIGFSDILLKNKAHTFSSKDISYVDRIQANGRHLLALINSVLDLSKVETGHMELEITSVPLGDLARETIAELAPQASAGGVRLVADFPDAVAVIDTDRAKLKQVLLNLVANALKFTAAGEVRVALRADPLTGRALFLDVIDTGIGIPADRLPVVFQAFQQADNSTARQYGGTGLGLTISRSLSRLMGFDITVASEVGVGSTFSISFAPARPAVTPPPIVSLSDVAKALPQMPGDDHAEFLVLVIDDESDARVILKASFEALGCAVITAASVDEGLALARAMSPGMITLDLMMPQKSGWEALRELHADPVLRDIPIVVVSAVANEHRMQMHGALDYLEKPVTREDLTRVVGRSKAAVRTPPRRVA
jgi:signal transduction histidine kinase/CheY-like chemotaxis protein